jgi:hypothetical protein
MVPQPKDNNIKENEMGGSCQNVGFKVLTAVVIKSSIFCDITLRNPLKVN